VSDRLQGNGQALWQISDFIQLEQIADAMLYFCHNKSWHITGTVLPIDCGLVVTWIENLDELKEY
jgi:enoyl-[acyl-carrier-protein] reductase (NADH)